MIPAEQVHKHSIIIQLIKGPPTGPLNPRQEKNFRSNSEYNPS